MSIKARIPARNILTNYITIATLKYYNSYAMHVASGWDKRKINKKDKNLNKRRFGATVILSRQDFSNDYWFKPTTSVLFRHAGTSEQVVKLIWHKAASPPHMNGSVVFFRWRKRAPIYRKPKMVAMATALRTSKSAMSSSDSLTPKTHL